MTASAPLRARIADPVTEGALRIGRNVSFRLASQAASALINVAGMILLGNALGARAYGEYAFYYALIQLVAAISDAGVGTIVTREIARHPEHGGRILGDALLLKGAIAAVILVAGLAAWGVLDAPRAALLTIVAVTALIDLGQDASIWALRAHERQDLEALLLLLSQLVWLLGLAAGVALGAGLPALLGAATLGFAVRLATGAVIVARRFHRPVFRPDPARLRRLLVQGLPLGAALFGVVLYGRVGLLALKALGTPSDLGYFQVAYMLSQPLGFAASGIAIAVLPDLSRRALEESDAVRRMLRATIKALFLLAFPLTVALLLLAGPILALLFPGRAFARAAEGLQIMSLGLTFIFLNLMSRYLLAGLDRQRHYLMAVLAGLVANVLLCVALVPRWGCLGACAAYVGAELVIGIVCQRALARDVPLREIARVAARPLLAALGAGLVVGALRTTPLALAGAAGGAAYLALLIALGTFSRDERRVLRGVWVSIGTVSRPAPRPAPGGGRERLMEERRPDWSPRRGGVRHGARP